MHCVINNVMRNVIYISLKLFKQRRIWSDNGQLTLNTIHYLFVFLFLSHTVGLT